MKKVKLERSCENCTRRFEEDCGHRFKNSSGIVLLIPSLSACDRVGACEFFSPDPDCQLLQVTLTESKAKQIQEDLNKMLEEVNSLQKEIQKMIDDFEVWL